MSTNNYLNKNTSKDNPASRGCPCLYSYLIIYLQPTFCPVTAVEVAIADGLGDVVGLDALAAFEVGDGAGDLEDAAVGTGRVLIHR